VKSSWKERFLTLVAAHHGQRLMKFFISRLPNSSDAPDLVQEVYMRILRLDRPDLIRSPEAYLFTIASNIAHEHRLKTSRQPLHIALEDLIGNEPSSEELRADIESLSSVEPEDLAVQQERIQHLERSLAELSPKARATLIWHRRDGRTYNEIGERLGVSRNMVKKYLSQAVAHCRKRIEKETGE
jgi:RNA polymerase sigma-70 factor (ECF subfamily)